VLLNDPAAAVAVFRALGRLRPSAFETVSDAAHALSLIGMEAVRTLVTTLPELTRDQSDCDLRETAAHAYSQAAHAGHYAAALAAVGGMNRNHGVHTAALLRHPALLALWADDREAARRATEAVRRGAGVDDAFAAELGEPLGEADRRLAEAWSLPLLARQAADDRDGVDPGPRLVRLADGLAQSFAIDPRPRTHEASTAALAGHLACELDAATAWLHQQAVVAARALHGFGYPLPAFELPFADPLDDDTPNEAQRPESGTARATLPLRLTRHPELKDVVADALRRIREEAGATRVMFANIDAERTRLRTRFALGGAREDALRQFDVDLGQRHLFSMLIQRPQSVWLHRDNAKKYQAHVPPDLRRIFGSEGAFLMSVFVRDQPLGLLYADGRGLDAGNYARFRRLCREVSERLADTEGPDVRQPRGST
jgi:hypothetical protein